MPEWLQGDSELTFGGEMGDIYTEMRDRQTSAIKNRLGLIGIIIATTAAAPGCCRAQEAKSFTIYWENDGTFLKPNDRTDRHYTDGIKLAFTHQPQCDWLKGFARWNNFADDNTKVSTAVGYFLGQNMFTPDHVGEPNKRNARDRVFAGWLYTGIFAQRATADQMEHFELNLGLIGPSARADEVQRFIHEMVLADNPKGWENQIGDEFAIDVTWFKRQRADELLFLHSSNFDSHLEYGFTAGSAHRNAILSILLRGGINLPNNFGPGRLEAPACAIEGNTEEPMHFYLFSRIGAKLVEHDRFLTGLDERLLVGQFQLGAAFRYKSFEITYSQTFLTREYDEQPDEDSFGSLNLTYRF
jgi:hypothetical protein